jgi:hypothetical protein
VALIDELSSCKAAFYFVERDGAALFGSHELIALAARWLEPSGSPAATPDILPVWMGSYLPFEAALKRWAFPDVFAVVIGCSEAKRRRALVSHVRHHPPMGMFDTDADANALDLPLVLHGFIVPQAAIRFDARGRSIERETGLDIIGFASDEEEMAMELAVSPLAGEVPYEVLGDALLRLLAGGAGRQLPGVRGSEGFEALVDRAFELLALGAIALAGVVCGVAFEQLMRAAMAGSNPVWIEERQARGHVALNDLIGKLASTEGWDDTRLRGYQRLRNDLAHRLGDDTGALRGDDELYESVERLLDWLSRQRIVSDGTATLLDVAPERDISYQQLLDEALAAGNAAAAHARTTQMTINNEAFDPIGFAWVTVRQRNLPFTRWLLESGHASPAVNGAQLHAPDSAFERALAWAHACAMRLRQAGYSADYAGRPD